MSNQLVIFMCICIFSYFCHCGFSSMTTFPFAGTISYWHIAGNNMVVYLTNSPNQLQFYDFQTKNNIINITSSLAGSASSIITHPLNNNASYCFNLQTISTYISSFVSLASNSTISDNTTQLSGQNFATWGFGNNCNQFYVTVNNPTGAMLYWNRASGNQSGALSNRNCNIYDQLFSNNSIYYVCLDKSNNSTSVLTVHGTSAPGYPIYFNSFNYTNCPTMKIDAYQQFLLINCGIWNEVRQNYPPYSVLRNFYINQSCSNILFACQATTVLCKRADGKLIQYWVKNGTAMSSMRPTITNPYNLKWLDLDIFYIFNSTSGIILNVSNITTIFPNPLTPAITNSTIVNQYDPFNIDSLFNFTKLIGNTIAFTSIRFVFPASIPIQMFIEQFWLYNFYINLTYPQIMKTFMKQVDILNFLKINPTFISAFMTELYFSSSFQANYTSQSTSYSQLYFFKAASQYFITNIMLSAVMFIIFKIFKLIFTQFVKSKVCLIKIIRTQLKQRSRFSYLLISFLEWDFLSICFYSLNQFALPFAYTFSNKINLMVSSCIFFILVVYGFVGYSIICFYVQKNKSNILTFTEKNRLFSYMTQNTLILSLRLIKCFAHSLIISNLMYKLEFLVVCDAIIVIYLLVMRKYFFNVFIGLFFIGYQIGVLIVNLGLLIIYFQNSYISDWLMEYFKYALIILLVLTVLKFIGCNYRSMKDMLIKMKSCQTNTIIPRNKISDMLNKSILNGCKSRKKQNNLKLKETKQTNKVHDKEKVMSKNTLLKSQKSLRNIIKIFPFKSYEKKVKKSKK